MSRFFSKRQIGSSRTQFALPFGKPDYFTGSGKNRRGIYIQKDGTRLVVPIGIDDLPNYRKGGRVRDKQPPKTKKYFRSTKSGAGMTKAGVARYRRENPGSKLKTAVTGKVKKGSKAANRRKVVLCKKRRSNEKISKN